MSKGSIGKPVEGADKDSGITQGSQKTSLSSFERGFLIGILVGEGHFGGDGKQPHVTLRMHVRHESLFQWLERMFPRARLYGPYHHGGRSYYQWIVRGRALAEDLIPELEAGLSPQLDVPAWERYRAMRENYRVVFERMGVKEIP